MKAERLPASVSAIGSAVSEPPPSSGRELGRALEQARVDIENVARKGLAARRLAGQQRELAMGRGVLRQIVDDDERVAAAVAEIFADREAGERRDPLQRRGRRGRGDDEHAALRRAELPRRLDHPLDRGRALADRDIDADHVGALLVDDRIDRDRRLAGRAVADDELALAAPERKERVDDQNAGRDRLGDERAIDDRRRRPLDRMEGLGRDRLVAVERAAERIDHAAEQAGADRHARDLAGRRDAASRRRSPRPRRRSPR